MKEQNGYNLICVTLQKKNINKLEQRAVQKLKENIQHYIDRLCFLFQCKSGKHKLNFILSQRNIAKL